MNLGGIVNQFDTSVGLNGGTTQGTPIDLEGNGLNKSLSSFQASGTWRWAANHRSDFLYFSAKRSGSKQYDRDITWGDNVYKAGFDINAQAKDEFLFLDYRYSFLKSDALEFAGVLGLYGGRFNFDLNGTVSVAGGARRNDHCLELEFHDGAATLDRRLARLVHPAAMEGLDDAVGHAGQDQ